jgi:peptidoglycan/xylan/chitin deacetylase (PgdA/CDA1 family)
MAGAGVPYLIAVAPRVSRAPLDPAVTVSRPLGEDETAQLHMVAREGATIGLHGLDHRTRFVHPRRHSELCGLDVARAAARIDESLAELARAGVARPEVFVPPFNRFDAAHYPLLAARFPVVCGGPETIGTLGFHRTPLWRDGAVYLPSYAPLYGPARVVLPAAREMIERRQALWAPITLHWGWEADEDWHALGELARAIAPVTASWEPFIALARRERAA